MTIAATAGRAGNPERRFYMAMILAMIGTVLLGFARSYFLRPLFPGFPSPPEAFFYDIHGVLFVGWMLPNSLVCVAREEKRATTTSPSAIISSMVKVTSGKAVR